MQKINITIALAAAAGLLSACATGPRDAESDRRAQAVFDQAFAASGRPDMVAKLKQDEVQRVCTEYRNNPPKDIAERLERSQMAGIPYPARLMGDWRKGEKIAQDGYGLRFTDTDAKRPNGGNCYACHQLAPQELSYGTLGPSLYQFGKLRGASEQTQRYAWGKVYNSQAYVACSNMPRLGHNRILTPEQISDVVALLLDPDSPVNK